MRLFLCRKFGRPGALHVFCLRRSEDTRIVADEHHAEECAGNLAQPAEASEYKKCCCDQSRYTQSRYVTLSEITEKVTEHIGNSAIGDLPQKIRYSTQF